MTDLLAASGHVKACTVTPVVVGITIRILRTKQTGNTTEERSSRNYLEQLCQKMLSYCTKPTMEESVIECIKAPLGGEGISLVLWY